MFKHLFSLLFFSLTSSTLLLAQETYQHIILYGQSYSTGSQSYPPISTENIEGNFMIGDQVWISRGNTNFSILSPLKSTIATSDLSKPKEKHQYIFGESPVVGLTNHLQNKKPDNYVASADGEDGKSIEVLSKHGWGNKENYYSTNFQKSIKSLAGIANTKGIKINSPAIFFMQGEYNYSNKIDDDTPGATSDKDAYKIFFVSLKNDMQADIMTEYGQAQKPVFITYQAGSLNLSGDLVSIGNAQVEVSNTYKDIICAGPTYQMPHRQLHLDPNGYRWYGEMLGKVFYKTQVLKEDFKPLQPKKIYRINSNKIGILFHVPVPPLAFDTKLVPTTPNQGFKILKNGVEQSITVTISGNEVILSSTANLDGALEIIYGSHILKVSEHEYRAGNLRDSDNYISLYNYVNLDAKDENDAYIYPRNTAEGLKPNYEPLDQDGSPLYDKKYPLYNFSVAFSHFLDPDQSEKLMPGFFSQDIIYVKKGATGNGTSWSNAMGELADAIKLANENNSGEIQNIKQIWVTQGTYSPKYRADNLSGANTKDRFNSFVLPKNVDIYGGFSGAETQVSQRNWKDNPTILSGDFNGDDGASFSNTSENALHTVISSGDVGSTILDGFTIQGGNANIEGSLQTNGYDVQHNYGGGIYVTVSSPKIYNVKLINNQTSIGGGGIILNYGSEADITNLTINNNKAQKGGGAFIYLANPKITNTIVSENTASDMGGGVYTEEATPIFTNITLVKNLTSKTAGGNGMFNANKGNPKIYNSIIWGNGFWNYNITNNNSTPQYFNSLVENNTSNDENGNISGDKDPMLLSIDSNNFHLHSSSPVINKGNNGYNLSSFDLDGNARITGEIIDLGAYEFQDVCDTALLGISLNNITINYKETLNTTINNLPSDAVATFEYEGVAPTVYTKQSTPPTDAGTYKIISLVSDYITGCQKTLISNLVINKIDYPAYTFANKTVVYNGSSQSMSLTGTPPTGTSISYTYEGTSGTVYPISSTPPTNAGNYIVKANLVNNNYNNFSYTANLTISKTDFIGVTFNNGIFTYNGNPQSIFISGQPAGTTITYLNNAQVNAGTYEVTATLKNVNYNDQAIKANLIINKAPAIITAEEKQEYQHDGSIKEVVASLNHNETVLTYSPKKGQSTAGTHTITISAEETTNYLSTSKIIELIINSMMNIDTPEGITVEKLKISPNPVSTILKVILPYPSSSKESVKIYSLLGRLVLHEWVMPGESIKEINFKGLNPGTYILKYKNNSVKIIKD